MLLDAVFLVPHDLVHRLEETVAGAADALVAEGFDITLTGPWPAFRFGTTTPSERALRTLLAPLKPSSFASLLDRQAIRRMEAETLTPDEIERIGLALMRLEETVHELGARFGLAPEELNLDRGPLGRLA